MVGGYILVRGAASQRWTVALIAGGLLLQQLMVLSAERAGLDIRGCAVTVDLLTNGMICAGFLALALRYRRENWLLAAMGLQAAELLLDSFVFQDEHMVNHLAFPDVANGLALMTLVVLAWATARSRGRRRLPETKIRPRPSAAHRGRPAAR